MSQELNLNELEAAARAYPANITRTVCALLDHIRALEAGKVPEGYRLVRAELRDEMIRMAAPRRCKIGSVCTDCTCAGSDSEANAPGMVADSEPQLPVELRGVAETVKEGGGFWTSCTGCYDTEDGRPTMKYAHSDVLGCELGNGCSECGGIGAVWDDTDYAEMAEFMMREEAPGMMADSAQAEPVAWIQEDHGNTVVVWRESPKKFDVGTKFYVIPATENARLRTQVDQLLQHCDDPECHTCGKIICPHGEPLHFHHDGCPSCE